MWDSCSYFVRNVCVHLLLPHSFIHSGCSQCSHPDQNRIRWICQSLTGSVGDPEIRRLVISSGMWFLRLNNTYLIIAVKVIGPCGSTRPAFQIRRREATTKDPFQVVPADEAFQGAQYFQHLSFTKLWQFFSSYVCGPGWFFELEIVRDG